MAFEPMDDDGIAEEHLTVPVVEDEPAEARKMPAGHLLREINGVRILVRVPSPHQVIAYNRAMGVLQDKAWKVQEDKKLTAEKRYRALVPFVVDMDSKALAFAESMMPDEEQRLWVDEWLIQGVLEPVDLVRQLQGITRPKDDDSDPEVVEVKKRPNPLKKAVNAKKTASARRTQR